MWIEIEQVGEVFKNARLGTVFEGRRRVSPEDSDMELFHICRNETCKFPASNSRNSDYFGSGHQTRATLHVKNFAFPDKTAAVAPVSHTPWPIEVAQVMAAPNGPIAGVIVPVLGSTLRIEQGFPNIDVWKGSSNAISPILYGVVANIVSFVSTVENGVMGG